MSEFCSLSNFTDCVCVVKQMEKLWVLVLADVSFLESMSG